MTAVARCRPGGACRRPMSIMYASPPTAPSVVAESGFLQATPEPDAGSPTADIVVQVAVQPFEAGIDVGCQRDEQELDVEIVETERPGKVAEPTGVGASVAGIRAQLTRWNEMPDRRRNAIEQ